MNEKSRPRQRSRSIVVAVLVGAAFVVVAALLLTAAFFFKTYRIPQNGMYPGLPSGSFILTSKKPYTHPENVRRGDIVIFLRQENGNSYTYIWRVIGLPGETVEASGWGLKVNGHVVERWRIGQKNGRTLFDERIGEASYQIALADSPEHQPPDVSVTVPTGHFFVMGDNRLEARDSRSFGAIPFESIVGKKL